MSKITPSFLKLDGWLYEFKYNSAVDYEKIFNNISNDTKNDLLIVSDYYYYYLLLLLFFIFKIYTLINQLIITNNEKSAKYSILLYNLIYLLIIRVRCIIGVKTWIF